MRFHYLFDLQQEIDSTSAAHKTQKSCEETSSTPEISTGNEEDPQHRSLQAARRELWNWRCPRSDGLLRRRERYQARRLISESIAKHRVTALPTADQLWNPGGHRNHISSESNPKEEDSEHPRLYAWPAWRLPTVVRGTKREAACVFQLNYCIYQLYLTLLYILYANQNNWSNWI